MLAQSYPRSVARMRLFGLPANRGSRRLVVALSFATLLLWIGGSAILPLLPTYLRRHGSSAALVGIVMAAYFAASVLTQYPVGRLSDRIGRRPIILGGLVVFAVGSVGFALTSGPGPAIVFRALQGVGAGAVTVASAAILGTELPLDERGGAFGALYGSQMLALAIGPLLGTLGGLSSMGLLFVSAAVAAGFAALPVLVSVPEGRPTALAAAPAVPRDERTEELEALAASAPAAVARRGSRAHLRVTPALVGVVLVFAASGLLGGVYESCWTLLLQLRQRDDVRDRLLLDAVRAALRRALGARRSAGPALRPPRPHPRARSRCRSASACSTRSSTPCRPCSDWRCSRRQAR